MRHPLPAAGDRIYRAIKADLLNGGVRPGERIDAVGLAEGLGASLTPVRAALYRLVGERLIELRPNEGFHNRVATEAWLRDLYVWNEQVALLALRLAARQAERPPPARPPEGAPAASIADLLAAIAWRSGNEACAAAINGLNDQLHAARRAETALFDDCPDELAGLRRAWMAMDSPGLTRGLRLYHARRARAVPALIRRLHQSADGATTP